MPKVPAILFLLLLSLTSGGNLIMVNGQLGLHQIRLPFWLASIMPALKLIARSCKKAAPDNLLNHASVAMNLYYQCMRRNHWNCDFRGTGLVVVTDPGYGSCNYP